MQHTLTWKLDKNKSSTSQQIHRFFQRLAKRELLDYSTVPNRILGLLFARQRSALELPDCWGDLFISLALSLSLSLLFFLSSPSLFPSPGAGKL